MFCWFSHKNQLSCVLEEPKDLKNDFKIFKWHVLEIQENPKNQRPVFTNKPKCSGYQLLCYHYVMLTILHCQCVHILTVIVTILISARYLTQNFQTIFWTFSCQKVFVCFRVNCGESPSHPKCILSCLFSPPVPHLTTIFSLHLCNSYVKRN